MEAGAEFYAKESSFGFDSVRFLAADDRVTDRQEKTGKEKQESDRKMAEPIREGQKFKAGMDEETVI